VKRKEATVLKSVNKVEMKYTKIEKQIDLAADVIGNCKHECVEEFSHLIQIDVAKKIQNFWNLSAEERAMRIVQTRQCVNEASTAIKAYSSGYPLKIPLCVTCFRHYHGISKSMWVQRGKQIAQGQINFTTKTKQCS